MSIYWTYGTLQAVQYPEPDFAIIGDVWSVVLLGLVIVAAVAIVYVVTRIVKDRRDRQQERDEPEQDETGRRRS